MIREAERLYVEEGISVTEIVKVLDIPAQTIYRWLAAAKNKDGCDWDEQRRNFALSPQALVGIYSTAFKRWVVTIRKDLNLMGNPKVADSIAKHVSTLRKLDPRFGYLGAVLDIIQITNEYLGKHDPDLRDEMEAHWPAISGKNQRDRHQGIPLWYSIRYDRSKTAPVLGANRGINITARQAVS